MTPEAEPKKDDAKADAPASAPKSAEPSPVEAKAKAPSPAPKPPAPRYRYFTVPPATVRLPVDDLTALLPAGAWIGTDADKRRELSLPTAEVLEKNFPRVRFSRLSDLLPGCIRTVENAPEWIVLPTDRIALAYQPETRRELLSEPEKKSAVPTETPAVPAKPADAKPLPAWKRLLKPILAPPPEPATPAEESKAPADGQKTTEPASPAPAALAAAPPTPVPPPPAPVPLAERRLSSEAEARLQQALMTEDALPVARLVALGGALPSLQGVILTHGTETVRSSEFLASIDAIALTDGAKEILGKMGGTSGLHFKPTVTLYAESGPISFLQHGPLRLVVLHRERAFLPGVREKLDAILEAIATAS